MSVLTLTQDDVLGVLPKVDVFSTVESMFAALGRGEAVQPKQVQTLFPQGKGDFINYSGVWMSAGVYGLKTSPFIVQEKGYTVTAWTLLMSTQTGNPLLLVDSSRLTLERSAATTAVAVKYLACAKARSLAVIGSGAIGSEFAFFYRSLGVEVYLIEYLDRILPLEDDDVSAQISRSFRKAGIKVMTAAQVKSVDTSGELCRLTVETKKGTETVEAETVLSAVGVIPNTDYLGLEEVGVEMLRGRKVKVDEYYRTNVEGVYAIGDIIPTQALAHVASAEGICCVEAICGLNPKPIDYGNIPGCTYVTPEVASVGMTERAVKEAGIEYKVGKFFFLASGKAAAAGEKDGFVKLIVDAATDRILGAHLVGANVTEMISGIVAGRNTGMTASDLIHSVHPHPTMSEAIMEAAEASHGECIHQ